MYPEEVPRPAAPVNWSERVRALRSHPKISSGAVILAATTLGLVWHQNAASTPSVSARTSTSSSSGIRTATASSVDSAKGSTTEKSAAPSGRGSAENDAKNSLVVHIAGAVLAPGIRTLANTSRVADAIAAAGGARLDADLDRINLAAPIEDGSRIFVPIIGQPIPAVVSTSAGPSGGGTSHSDLSGSDAATALVNLNTATQAELESLPGVGPSLAQAILEQRESSGGFTSVDQLRSVHGIGDKRFSDLADKVTI